MSEADNISGLVAHKLSGLKWSLLEVADETDSAITGDIEDAIQRGLWRLEDSASSLLNQKQHCLCFYFRISSSSRNLFHARLFPVLPGISDGQH